MGGGTISTSETKIEAIRLQSSTYGAALSVVFGVTRVPGNMLWYNGFQAIAHTTTQRAGKGGGVKTKSTTYTYTAHVAMGLAEGPILGVPRVWRGKQAYSGGYTGAQVLTTTQNYTVAAGGGSVTVTNAASWAATVAVFYTGTMDQGDGTTSGPVYLAEGVDYTVANGVYTFGSAWSNWVLQIQYQYIPAGTESALASLGMTKFAGKVGQATWSLLSSSYPAQAIPYSGMAYVAAQDYDLGSDATVQNHTFEVQGPMAYHLGASVPDVDPALVAVSVLTNSRYGAQFPAARLNFGLWSRYCRAAGLLLSPAMTEQTSAADVLVKLGQLTNTAPVWSAGALKMIPFGDATLTGNGATYTPYTTALYNLDDSALLPGADGGEPITITYKPRADAWNHVRLEYLDRANDYNVAVAEAKDQADIDAFGLRSSDVIQAHWINDAAVARAVVQLILQRALYIRSTYKFRLPWTFALLEPMDLLTLTDSMLGFSSQAVRIIAIDEGEDGVLEVEAEEVPSGVSAAVLYPSQAGSGYIANFNAAPGNVSAPVIFEAPAELTTTGLEVYAAVTGTGANWGGCSVWVSLDGVSYYQAGTVYGGARYGTITGPVSGSSLPVTITRGQLVAASATDAAALTSLCYVGGATPEYLAHEGATLTSAQNYTLGGLVRAAYGTTASAHTAGDAFVRVDDGIGKSGPLSVDMVGKTIYFKFTSFNIYGAAEQELADVTAYSYAITGYMATRGPAILNYIKATNGTQLKNGVGSITLEARRVTEGTDSLLSSGTVQLYVGTTLVTAANGYGAGSNGYTGVFDSTDISGSLVVTLRDGPTGTIYGSLTLTNVTDGTNGAPGTSGATASGVVLNGGVELGDLTHWTSVGGTVATGNAYTGTYSIRIASAAGGPNAITNKWAAAPGEVYKLSCWVKRDETALPDQPVQLAARFYDSTGAQLTRTVLQTAVAGTAGWQLLQGEATAPTSTVTASLDVGEAPGATGFWFIDDAAATLKGTSAISTVATNEGATLIAYADGSVVSFAPASGRLYVYNGATDVTASATLTAVASGCTGTINTATNTPVNGQPVGFYQVTAMSADTATLTLTAVYGGQTLVRVFSLAKAKAGYEIVASLPATNLFAGRVVFLSTDSKLYRYTGSTWTAATAASDLSGNLGGSNLVLNSGFEAYTSSSLTFPSWGAFAGGAGDPTRVHSVTQVAAAPGVVGSYAMRLTIASGVVNATDSGVIQTSNNIPVIAGSTYSLSGWLRASVANKAYLTVRWYNAAGASISDTATSVLNVANGWVRLTKTAAAPATASYCNVMIRGITLLSEWLEADGVQFELSDAPTSYAPRVGEVLPSQITTDMLGAGAVTAAKIGVTDLSAIAANVGTLTAGVLRNSADTYRTDLTNGRTITQTGGYMKVTGAPFGSTSQFIEWYGPYQANLANCTESNAVYYLRTDGSAYFGGALLAGVLKNSVRATLLTSANVADLGPFSSNGAQITVTIGFTFLGNVSYPGTSGGLSSYNAATKTNPTFTLVLSRSLGGAAFVDVATYTVTGSWNGEAPIPADSSPGYYSQDAGYSATYTDPSLSTATRQYKLRFTAWNVNTTVSTNTLSIQSVEA